MNRWHWMVLGVVAVASAGCTEDAPGPSGLQVIAAPDADQPQPDRGARDQGVPDPRRDAAVDPRPDARVPDPQMDAGPDPDPRMDAGPDPDPRLDAGPVPDPDAGPTPDPDAGPDPDPLPPDPGVNAGWIGGPCERDADCDYAESFCLTAAEGYPRGQCSVGCERFCPDRDGMPVTFCVDDVIVGEGACIQRCDYDAFAAGCRPGYHCENRARYNEPDVRQGVCLPGPAMPDPNAGCYAQLDALGVQYQRANNPMDSPAGRGDLVCNIHAPLLLEPLVNGVTYRPYNAAARPMFMSCTLALAMYELSELLQESDIVEVGHIGTYNCRLIGGTNSLSEHGLGTAIDLMWFRDRDGTEFNVEDHWEHDTLNFRTQAGRFLYELGQAMFNRRVFNIILTPNYNAAHDNHFHVDMTDGAHFVGRADPFAPPAQPLPYIGPNPHGD